MGAAAVEHTQAMARVWWSEGNLQESVLSFRPRDRTQVVRLGNRHLLHPEPSFWPSAVVLDYSPPLPRTEWHRKHLICDTSEALGQKAR